MHIANGSHIEIWKSNLHKIYIFYFIKYTRNVYISHFYLNILRERYSGKALGFHLYDDCDKFIFRINSESCVLLRQL